MINRLLIRVFWGEVKPFEIGSEQDVKFIKAAQYAHERFKEGFSDSFLFIFCGIMFKSDAYAVLNRYGFPSLNIKCISPDDLPDEYEYDDDALEQISVEIEMWLAKYHAGFLPYPKGDGYSVLEPWWSGIEAIETEWECIEGFAKALPYEHKKRAVTWAEVLKDAGWSISNEWLGGQKFGLRAATLCEWLNGFDQVVENDSNDFSYDAAPEHFGLDNNYIAYLAGKIPEDSKDALDFDEIIDADDLIHSAFRSVVGNGREAPADLLDYFGGPGLLVPVLWFCIWPDYKSKMDEAMADLFPHIGLFDSMDDDIVRIERALELVEAGWFDWVDED